MTDTNLVVLIGRLTRDAELKYTQGGMPVCKFSIAVNKSKKNGDTWEDVANFFDIVLWGKQGETLNQYLVKGKQVAVEGELHQNRWEQDGQSRSKVEIMASNVQLLGGNTGGNNERGNRENPPAQRYESSPKPSQTREAPPMREPEDFADDIPF